MSKTEKLPQTQPSYFFLFQTRKVFLIMKERKFDLDFTKEQMRTARQTNLYDFLIENHEDEFVKEGFYSLRMIDDESISIRHDFCGYKNFSSKEKGNSVDFLTRHMGYTVTDAVLALCGHNDHVKQEKGETQDSKNDIIRLGDGYRQIRLPLRKNGPYKQTFAYLMNRGISADMIKRLVNDELLYQSEQYNNIVFVNAERDFAEERGTYTIGGKKFHRIHKTRPDRFWWFKPYEGDEPADAVYICESAIDAISLYELNTMNSLDTNAVYCGIGGVANQQTIDRIKAHNDYAILAVDNDDAGGGCRARNNDIEAIIPVLKDWNLDLQELKKEHGSK